MQPLFQGRETAQGANHTYYFHRPILPLCIDTLK